jgi:hypothetical protein
MDRFQAAIIEFVGRAKERRCNNLPPSHHTARSFPFLRRVLVVAKARSCRLETKPMKLENGSAPAQGGYGSGHYGTWWRWWHWLWPRRWPRWWSRRLRYAVHRHVGPRIASARGMPESSAYEGVLWMNLAWRRPAPNEDQVAYGLSNLARMSRFGTKPAPSRQPPRQRCPPSGLNRT